jgi:glycosyltransferase involved in cell wall biosynthesis
LEIEIFSLYPCEPELWKYVPDLLNQDYLPRKQIHHTSLLHTLIRSPSTIFRDPAKFGVDVSTLTHAAAKFGVRPVAKTFYSVLAAYAWAGRNRLKYDHILSYWANYSATCAYVFHKLIDPSIPFSFLVHAGTDLYRDPIYLREKLLYADNVIVVCDFNKQFLSQKYPEIYDQVEEKISLHHPGLDFSEYQYEPGGKAPEKIIAVGNLIKVKGFDHLLQAIGILKQRGWNLQLDLIGGGREHRALRSLAEKLGILQQINFHGWLPPEKTREFIRRATILIHPSSGLGDAVPTVIKEAMALGTPVIASRVAGIPELLDDGNCGILIPPGDIPELADAIETLLLNPKKGIQYAEKARQFAETYFDLWKNGLRLSTLLQKTKRSPYRDNLIKAVR